MLAMLIVLFVVQASFLPLNAVRNLSFFPDVNKFCIELELEVHAINVGKLLGP